jgi:hypothetical protein
MPEKEPAKGHMHFELAPTQIAALKKAMSAVGASEEDIKKQWEETEPFIHEYVKLPSPEILRLEPPYAQLPPWIYLPDQMYIHACEVLKECNVAFGGLEVEGTPPWSQDEKAFMRVTIANHSKHRVNNLWVEFKGEGVKVDQIRRARNWPLPSPNPCRVAALAAGDHVHLWPCLEPTEVGTPTLTVLLRGDVVPYGENQVLRTLPYVYPP